MTSHLVVSDKVSTRTDIVLTKVQYLWYTSCKLTTRSWKNE